jgi:fructokinase
VQILSLGELLWDVFEENEFLGGAPLNFSVAAQRLGNSVGLLTAVGADTRGLAAREAMQRLGLTTGLVQTTRERPTGTAIVSTNSQGSPSFSIARPAAFDCLHLDESYLDRLAQWNPEWIYFGTLAQANPSVEKALLLLFENFPRAQRFYDVNLRTGHWNLPLVERLSSMSNVLKLNDSEAEILHSLKIGETDFSLERFCREWASIFGIEAICVTLGARGCAIFANNVLRIFDGFSVNVVDTVGAGDAFAATLLHGYHQGWPLERSASLANAVGALVASRSGATPEWTMGECLQLIAASAPACGGDQP